MGKYYELLERLEMQSVIEADLCPDDMLCNDAASAIRELEAELEKVERMINANPSKETLTHSRSCVAFYEHITGTEVNSEQCTCGLRYRIHLQTAETISAAWRMRAEADESALASVEAETIERCAKVCEDNGLVYGIAMARILRSLNRTAAAQASPSVAAGDSSSEDAFAPASAAPDLPDFLRKHAE